MRQLKVLVIDDEENVLLFFRRLARHEKFEIITIKDAFEAMKSPLNIECDIAFLDIAMPKINGIEVLKKIKGANPSLSVYLMTGSEIEQIENHAVPNGAAGHLCKPFDLSKLVDIIRNAREKISS